jgi:hypothetical protein
MARMTRIKRVVRPFRLYAVVIAVAYFPAMMYLLHLDALTLVGISLGDSCTPDAHLERARVFELSTD